MQIKNYKKSRFLNRIKSDSGSWLLFLPSLLVLYFIIWRPQVMGIVYSLFKMKGYTPTEFVGFKNFADVIKDTQFISTLSNTAKYVLWSLVIGYLPPVIIAVMLNEIIHFKNFCKTSIYIPSILSGIAVSLMWYFMYYPDGTGLFNMILGKFGISPQPWLNSEKMVIPLIIISMTWKGMGASMLLYYTALQSVDTELYEVAEIDGAGMRHKFFNVTMPQISGILILNFVKQIIDIFQIMEQPLAMTNGGPNNASMSLGLQMYIYGFKAGRVGHAFALGNIMFVILIICTCFYFYMNKKVEDNYK